MIYKLFMFGTKELFKLVRIPLLEFSLKDGSVFVLGETSYKVLAFKLPAKEVMFDDNGGEKFPSGSSLKSELLAATLPELYITEIPQF